MSLYETPPPQERPEPGYYYHYKHDPKGAVNNYAYYICGVGHHTEEDCRPEDRYMQVYKPLYDSFVYQNGKMFDLRPLDMFYEPVLVGAEIRPRFAKISDPEVLKQLKAIRRQMYPEDFAD